MVTNRTSGKGTCLRSGRRDRAFKSRHPDHKTKDLDEKSKSFFFERPHHIPHKKQESPVAGARSFRMMFFSDSVIDFVLQIVGICAGLSLYDIIQASMIGTC